MSESRRLPGIVGALNATFMLVVGVALIAGITAAVLGGSFSRLGGGYGGLWGVPALLLTFSALVFGVIAAAKIARGLGPGDGRLRIALLVVVGVWVVAIGYAEVAHQIDPCARGWWDASSRLGSQPLCERFGPELNWHTRFHLLAHVVPAALLLGLYILVMRRWGQPNVDDAP